MVTLAANVGLPLTMRRVPRAEAGTRVAALLDRFGLGAASAMHPAQLSDGVNGFREICRGLQRSALYGIPIIALIPLLILSVGIGDNLAVAVRPGRGAAG